MADYYQRQKQTLTPEQIDKQMAALEYGRGAALRQLDWMGPLYDDTTDFLSTGLSNAVGSLANTTGNIGNYISGGFSGGINNMASGINSSALALEQGGKGIKKGFNDAERSIYGPGNQSNIDQANRWRAAEKGMPLDEYELELREIALDNEMKAEADDRHQMEMDITSNDYISRFRKPKPASQSYGSEQMFNYKNNAPTSNPVNAPIPQTPKQVQIAQAAQTAEAAQAAEVDPYSDNAKSINTIKVNDTPEQIKAKLNSNKAGTAGITWANRGNRTPEQIAKTKALYNAMGPLAGKGHAYDGIEGQDYRRAVYDIVDQRGRGMLSDVAQQNVRAGNLEKFKNGFLDVDPTTEYGRSEMLRMLGPDALNNLPQKYMSARQAGPGAKTVSDATPVTSGQGVDAPQNMAIDIDWNRRVREAADANMRGENVPYPEREVQSSNRTPSSDPIPDYSSSFTRQPGAPANASAVSGPLPTRDMRGDTYTSRITGQPVFNQAKADRDSMRMAEINSNQLQHMANQANYSSGGQESRWADKYGRDVTPPAQAVATPKTISAASSALGVNNMRDNMTPTNIGGDNPSNFGGTVAKNKPDSKVNGFF